MFLHVHFWLNRVSTDLANSQEKYCLTIDCDYINKNGSGRYRSSAENPEKQPCYFISERVKGDKFDDGIYFKIEKS